MSDRTLFVARERELAQLDHFLQRSLSGEGAVCFVTGEAGSGKTALVNEFARRAQMQHDDLVFAVGQCDAQTGTGDSYLPFRELLSLLTGDVEGKLARGDISKENAGRLRQFLRYSGQAIVELGPDLLGIFVPGAGLVTRAGTFLVEKVGWLDKLQSRIDRSKQSPLPTTDAIRQENIFEQYTNVLIALAKHRPLLLILDDLQWADTASTGLLFRLGRRLGGNPILLIGTYRPAEVALGRDGERHPLDKVLAEFKRYFGDIKIELGQTPAEESRHFVDALLDTEPNQLGDSFRQELYHHTGGHPLFSIELLRAMQERGDLVKNSSGKWVEGPTLDWGQLPTRVEGVIEERIGRLEVDLRETLTLASVEGENFAAETIASVQRADARRLVRQLSSELEKQHQLVASQQTERLDGGQRISHYRFQHNLFQRYLYGELDEAERAYLHEDVGLALEALYGERSDEIALQLARHFVEAQVDEKARIYLGKAGEQAAARYAHVEALAHLNRALELVSGEEPAARYALLLAREQVYNIQGNREAQYQDLEDLRTLAEKLDDQPRRTTVALRQAKYARVTGDYPTALAAAQEAVTLATTLAEEYLQARGHLEWAKILRCQGAYAPAKDHLEQALSLAHASQDYPTEAQCMQTLGLVHWSQGDYPRAQGCLEQALDIWRKLGDLSGEGGSLNNLGAVSAQQGDLVRANDYFEQALPILQQTGALRAANAALSNLGSIAARQGDRSRAQILHKRGLHNYQQIGDHRNEGIMFDVLAMHCNYYGDYDQARTYLEQSLLIAQEIGNRRGEYYAWYHLALVHYHRQDYLSARESAEQSLRVARELGNRDFEGAPWLFEGHALAGLGDLDRAVEAYQQALHLHQELGQPNLALEVQAGLARIALAQEKPNQALLHIENVLANLETDILDGTDEPFLIYLTCFRVLQANDDPRAGRILCQAYDLLQEQAARLSEPDMHHSFLVNVAAHQEITATWKSQQTL